MRLARGFGPGAPRGIEWGNDHLAIVAVARFSDRKSMMLAFDPSTREGPRRSTRALRRSGITILGGR